MTSQEDRLVVLYSGSSEAELGLVLGAVEAAGVEAFDVSSNYARVMWVKTQALHLPYRVMVRASELARAREVASEVLVGVDGEAIDWDTVDVGEPVDATAAALAARDDELDVGGEVVEFGDGEPRGRVARLFRKRSQMVKGALVFGLLVPMLLWVLEAGWAALIERVWGYWGDHPAWADVVWGVIGLAWLVSVCAGVICFAWFGVLQVRCWRAVGAAEVR